MKHLFFCSTIVHLRSVWVGGQSSSYPSELIRRRYKKFIFISFGSIKTSWPYPSKYSVSFQRYPLTLYTACIYLLDDFCFYCCLVLRI
ncbi:hypothetical protein BC829DRAFT_399503 [Chytridium lagenaria]|nr:hypothetical protein BC829DRAFT_399503 [Chytridium lagenaria]